MTKPTTEEAYVTSGERFLDPTLLDKTAIERMPDPTGWRMLVFPFKGRKTSDGGIHLYKKRLTAKPLLRLLLP